MEKTRLTLQTQLEELMGNNHVYFSAPTKKKMEYPCIRYSLVNARTESADNIVYMNRKRYTLTCIDPDPDSVIPDKLLNLPYCSFDRTYTQDNLNHFVFTLYW